MNNPYLYGVIAASGADLPKTNEQVTCSAYFVDVEVDDLRLQNPWEVDVHLRRQCLPCQVI